jgi:membrane associated rhomboid family serine protease
MATARRSVAVGWFPILTTAAVTAATLAAIVQYAAPGSIAALERDPAGLANGQWWRAVTPLAVQTLGWYQVLANLVTLALIGLVAERLLGRRRWGVLFVAGTLGGQVAAYAWHEPGGGDSIAVCGLAGGVVVALLAAPAPVPPLAARTMICYIAALTGWGLRGTIGAGLGVLGAAVLLYGPRPRTWPAPERLALVGAAGCCVALSYVGDLQGVSLLSGAAAMTLVLAAGQRARAGAWASPARARDRETGALDGGRPNEASVGAP